MSVDTGRLATAAAPEIRRMLLDPAPPDRPPWKVDLDRISQVDLAHVVMLVEQGIIDREVGARLLDTIVDLREQDFEPLQGRPAPRGLYLAYEQLVVERSDKRTGGALHTGRSRNDLNATCLKLGLRDPYDRLVSGLVGLGVVLLNRARRHRDVVMPAYTHFQAAVPITYGHYLLGLAAALVRETQALLDAGTAMDECPLGAGAVGGTTIAIDTTRTARLLGFTTPVLNSVDAVASRDVVLRLLAACATVGVPVDRAAQDLLLWSTAEFAFLTVPNGLVGSSSMMPQKRNVFVLEHVQGMTAAPLGAFVTAVSAMRGTPFTNSISVGTEAVRPVWSALADTTKAVRILRMAMAGATPCPDAMLDRAGSGMTTATALAEKLVGEGIPFRRAHHEVGAAVRAVLAAEAASLPDAVAARLGPSVQAPVGYDAAAVRAEVEFGGGPGPRSFDHALDTLFAQWMRCRSRADDRFARWHVARRELRAAVAAIRNVPRGRS